MCIRDRSRASPAALSEEPNLKPDRQVTAYSRKRRASSDQPEQLGFDAADDPDAPGRASRRARVVAKKTILVAPVEVDTLLSSEPSPDSEDDDVSPPTQPEFKVPEFKVRPPVVSEFAIPRLPAKRRLNSSTRMDNRQGLRFSRDSHELHSNGEVDMMIDDMEYQQQGLGPGQKLVVQQASAVQITTLLCNPKMRHMLRGRNLLAGVLHKLRDACMDGDRIQDYVLCVSTLLAILVFTRSQREAVCVPEDMIDFLMAVLKTPPNPGPIGSTHLKPLKTAARVLKVCHSCDGKLPLRAVPTALEALSHLLKHSEQFRVRVVGIGGFESVAEALANRLKGLQEGNEAHPCIEEMACCLKVLDTLTGRKLGEHMATHKRALLHTLCGLLVHCKKLLVVPDFDFEGDSLRDLAVECILGVLRVLVNLTNEDADAGATFAAAGGLDAASSLLLFTDESEYDILALSLGLLINCVEHSNDNKFAMRSVMLAPVQSTRGRPGAKSGQPALKALCELFQSRAKKKNGQPAKQAQDNAIAAYSALLIGCISQEASNREDVLGYLKAETFGGILAVLRQFLRDQAMAGIGDELTKMRECIEEIIDDLS
eukprot:TRINITY_DN44638_c0_g1_i4.p1 TRINITY_DN44638_c0_g1~~TRINITY_DN44638_c0_g1_i4.p1  ORF type:complete len:598 (-),score=113.59 TRINITY_DN44638_c0_g1_i4:67-1860(-)